jgi:2-C-methyl-D-erythritol 4-phosphate cytidylyltransferase / 2-C-methyl-D-erythritol 2,4-cyclodiphosphate synthase
VTALPASALIVAGGRGTRAGGGLPKQYRDLAGLPVLRRSVLTFLERKDVERVQVVIHPDDQEAYETSVGGLDLPPPVLGGATRQESVRLGLEALAETGMAPQATVMIHDAARPLASHWLIERCLAKAADMTAAGETVALVPALAVADSLRRAGDRLIEAIDRSDLVRVQTPQCFALGPILEAHRRFAGLAEPFTDDAALMMAAGYPVATVAGEERNFKLTAQEDFERAEACLGLRASVRTGFGFDVHAFEDGDHVWIGGIRIPHGKGLKGHSDADVALHALTDALLGAIAAGDIGDHFPPSDPQWRGAPSHLFLDHARALVEEADGLIQHVDVTIICEAPRIGPHRQAMRERIAGLLRVPLARVSVKATTTERLGFTGRGEGVAAQAVATVSVNGQ